MSGERWAVRVRVRVSVRFRAASSPRVAAGARRLPPSRGLVRVRVTVEW